MHLPAEFGLFGLTPPLRRLRSLRPRFRAASGVSAGEDMPDALGSPTKHSSVASSLVAFFIVFQPNSIQQLENVIRYSNILSRFQPIVAEFSLYLSVISKTTPLFNRP